MHHIIGAILSNFYNLTRINTFLKKIPGFSMYGKRFTEKISFSLQKKIKFG